MLNRLTTNLVNKKGGCKQELMELQLKFLSARPQTHLALRKFTRVHHQ